jgi:hypothetical protein
VGTGEERSTSEETSSRHISIREAGLGEDIFDSWGFFAAMMILHFEEDEW